MVPGIPPSLNKWLRMHPMKRYKEGQRWKTLVVSLLTIDQARNGPLPTFPRARVTLEYHFPSKRYRDPDNYTGAAKALIDGLRAAALVSGDHFGAVELQAVSKGIDPKNPRVEIVVEPLEGERCTQ